MNWREIDPRLLAVAASLLLSGYTLLFPELMNDDAYTYVRTAEIYQEFGLSAALNNYAWPFYSLVMSVLNKLTGLNLFHSGLLINAAFFALLSYSFVSLVRLLTPSLTAQHLAVLIVLVYPQLNEYRYLVIRDVGFWALTLFALWQFIEFLEADHKGNLIAFVAAILLATAFRAESLLFLFTLPFGLLFSGQGSRENRQRRFFESYAIIAVLLLLSYSILWLAGFSVGRQLFGFLFTYLPFFQEFFVVDEQLQFQQSVTVFSEYAASYSQRYLSLFMAAGFLAILIASIVKGIGLPYLLLLIYGLARRTIPQKRILVSPVVIMLLSNLAILLLFILITRFLSSRYTMMFSIVAVLFVPFILDSIITKTRASGSARNIRTAIGVLSVFFGYCLLDAYYSFGERKDYIVSAAEWIETNSDDSSDLLTNNHAIAYASGRVEAYDRIQRTLSLDAIHQASAGTIIAVESYRSMTDIIDEVLAQEIVSPLASFSDSERPRVQIYRRN